MTEPAITGPPNHKYLAWLVLANDDNLAKVQLIIYLRDHVVGADAAEWKVKDHERKVKAVCMLAVAKLAYSRDGNKIISRAGACRVLGVRKSTYTDFWRGKIDEYFNLINEWASE